MAASARIAESTDRSPGAAANSRLQPTRAAAFLPFKLTYHGVAVRAAEPQAVGPPVKHMDSRFRDFVETLEPQFRVLLSAPPRTFAALGQVPAVPGIYLFSERDHHLYVGRTSNLRNRLRAHCSPSSTHLKAAFAFRLAREATGNLQATYRTEGSRAHLAAMPEFAEAFQAAKKRMTLMEIRFVREDHAIRQALLEMYVAVVLETPYNDFENH